MDAIPFVSGSNAPPRYSFRRALFFDASTQPSGSVAEIFYGFTTAPSPWGVWRQRAVAILGMAQPLENPARDSPALLVPEAGL
jgi:hypothetical protein